MGLLSAVLCGERLRLFTDVPLPKCQLRSNAREAKIGSGSKGRRMGTLGPGLRGLLEGVARPAAACRSGGGPAFSARAEPLPLASMSLLAGAAVPRAVRC